MVIIEILITIGAAIVLVGVFQAGRLFEKQVSQREARRVRVDKSK